MLVHIGRVSNEYYEEMSKLQTSDQPQHQGGSRNIRRVCGGEGGGRGDHVQLTNISDSVFSTQLILQREVNCFIPTGNLNYPWIQFLHGGGGFFENLYF